jgi:hypothetical protein
MSGIDDAYYLYVFIIIIMWYFLSFIIHVCLFAFIDLIDDTDSIIGKIVQRANLLFDSSYSEEDLSSSKEYINTFQTTEMLKDVLQYDKERTMQDEKVNEREG